MQKNSEEGIRGAQNKVPNTHISEIEVVASRYKQMTGPADQQQSHLTFNNCCPISIQFEDAIVIQHLKKQREENHWQTETHKNLRALHPQNSKKPQGRKEPTETERELWTMEKSYTLPFSPFNIYIAKYAIFSSLRTRGSQESIFNQTAQTLKAGRNRKYARVLM